MLQSSPFMPSRDMWLRASGSRPRSRRDAHSAAGKGERLSVDESPCGSPVAPADCPLPMLPQFAHQVATRMPSLKHATALPSRFRAPSPGTQLAIPGWHSEFLCHL